jgi:hypothetical protein
MWGSVVHQQITRCAAQFGAPPGKVDRARAAAQEPENLHSRSGLVDTGLKPRRRILAANDPPLPFLPSAGPANSFVQGRR